MNYNEYLNLVNEAKRHSFLYYVASRPEISDAEFDALVSNIEAYEQEHPSDILPDSPTQTIGSDLNGNGRRLVTHRSAMLSQQKAYSVVEIEKWMEKLSGTPSLRVEWKFDGVSCSLVYVDGMLCSASTRGNGMKGQDITDHVRQMSSVPQNIEQQGRVEVRGEVLCPKGEHIALGYKDERSAASSITNMSYSDAARSLVFYPWEVIADDFNSFSDSHRLCEWGFREADSCIVNDHRCLSGIVSAYAANRAGCEFPTDGLVIKVDSMSEFRALGCTATNPRGSIAYKFEAECAYTVVRRIEINEAESGRRTPVAFIDPIVLRGKTVSKINLYTEKTMNNLGVTEGCTVKVIMQGDVIAKIVEVVNPDNILSDEPEAVEPVVETVVPDEEVVDYNAIEELENQQARDYWKEEEDRLYAENMASLNAWKQKKAEEEAEKERKAALFAQIAAEREAEEQAKREEEDRLEHERNKFSPKAAVAAVLAVIGVIGLCVIGIGMAAFLVPAVCGAFK